MLFTAERLTGPSLLARKQGVVLWAGIRGGGSQGREEREEQKQGPSAELHATPYPK